MSGSLHADCRSFGPGHGTHWIHARKFAEGRPAADCTVIDGDHGSGLLVLLSSHGVTRCFHHDVARVLRSVQSGTTPQLSDQWHILRIDGHLANIELDDVRWKPCSMLASDT